MTSFITTRGAFLFKQPDPRSTRLGQISAETSFEGESAEGGFIETHIKDISGEIADRSPELTDHPQEPMYIDEARARKALIAPETISKNDHEDDIFCILVTRFARDIGTNRDYLMAVAYSGTENLAKLGDVGAKRVGPFQFTKEEWNTAITTGPAKDRQFSLEDRFRWNSQAEVAAMLAADCTIRLKADAALGKDPTYAELYLAQLFGPGADAILKSDRTSICPKPPDGTYAADLGLASSNQSISNVLSDLQRRLDSGFAEAWKVIEKQPPEIRIFDISHQADPPWLAVARNEEARGVSETIGGRNTEEIKEYFKFTDFQDDPSTTAWCGAFGTFCMKKSGIPEVESSINRPGPALAAWWREWGKPADDTHRIGTVVVLKEIPGQRSGHVGFLVGESDGKIQLLAGNQGKGQTGADHVGVVSFDREKEEPVFRWLDVPSMGTTIGGLDARSLHQKGIEAASGDRRFIEKAPDVMKRLMNDFPALTREQAAAILGNIGQECGGFTLFVQQGKMNDEDRGFGWCQWTHERRDAFFQYATAHGLPRESDDASYGYLVTELRGSERRAFEALQRESVLENAVITFNNKFERSGTPMMDRRIRYAQLALDAF
jgi:uncharacterized protein (TIGR02594 family)